MQVYNIKIVFQEIPSEITIGLSCLGCGGPCKGCHSPHLHALNENYNFSLQDYKDILDKYNGKASCVCFFGGEWFKELPSFLKLARDYGYKTALYSAETKPREELIPLLDYYKVGPYIEELGGLDHAASNQKMYRILNPTENDYILEDITYKMKKKGL